MSPTRAAFLAGLDAARRRLSPGRNPHTDFLLGVAWATGRAWLGPLAPVMHPALSLLICAHITAQAWPVVLLRAWGWR